MQHLPVPCPGCGAPLAAVPPGAPRSCGPCRLPLDGPPAAELWTVDRALADLDAHRAALMRRRGKLIAALRASAVRPAPFPVPPPPPAPADGARLGDGPPPAHGPHAPSRPKRDASPPTVQNMLLALGGVLLAVAAVVFTVVSWGRMGIGGRAAVLLALTGAALAAPALLVRRRLTSTAEVIAGLGLLLLLLDCLAARVAGLAGAHTVDPLRYWSFCLAAVAAGWAVYGRWLGLRSSAVAALLLAQLPACAFSLSVADTPLSFGWGLLVTAAVNAVAGLAVSRQRRAARTLAAVCGTVTGLACLGIGTGLSLTQSPAGVVRAAVFLLATAVLGTAAGYRLATAAAVPATVPGSGKAVDGEPPGPDGVEGTPPRRSRAVLSLPGVLCTSAGAAVIAGAGGVGRVVLPVGWEVIGWLLASVAVMAGAAGVAAVRRVPGTLPGGYAAAGAAVHGCLAVGALAAMAPALFAPLGWAGSVWSGAPPRAREALGPDYAWQGSLAVPVILAVTGSTLAFAVRWRGGRGRAAEPQGRYRTPALCVALTFAVATAVVLPVATDLPYTIAVLELVAVAGVLLAAAATLPSVAAARTAMVSGIVVAVVAGSWALAERPVTQLVLGLLMALFLGAAPAIGDRGSRAAAVSAAVGAAIALAWAVAQSLGASSTATALAVLAVRAVCLLPTAGARLRGGRLGGGRPGGGEAAVAAVSVADVASTAATGVAVVLCLGNPEAALVAVLAALLAVAAAALRAGDWRSAAIAEAGLLAALGPLLIAGAFLGALLRPFVWLREPWTGLAHTARSMPQGVDASSVPVPALLAAVAVLAAVAAVLAARIAGGGGWAARFASGALPPVLVVVAVGLDMPYWSALTVTVAGAVVLFRTAARATGGTAECAVTCGLLLSLTSAAWSTAGRGATLAVLMALAVAAAGCAWRARSPFARAATATAAVLALAAEAGALTLAAGQPVAHAAFPVLAVAGATVPVAARLRGHSEGRAVEVAGYAVATAAVSLTVQRPVLLASALALSGVLALGVSVRPDRRRAAWCGTALLIVASWVRLADASVHSPEAYTLPVTVCALFVGWLRRRHDDSVSSWSAYGAGLAVTLVPSLVAAWSDPDWPRPLLLGVGALVVTFAGARHRLKAPLLLGGGVLALDALHELAPAVMDVVDGLPRWVPLGTAGALLLVVGATYEARLRDVRRLRASLSRLR